MPMSRRFQVTRHGLTLDGEPFQVLSGAMHYFRTLPQQWPDRLAKLRAMGLNTVETYVPWNLHEPRPGEFTFTGLADVEGFLTAAEKAGCTRSSAPAPTSARNGRTAASRPGWSSGSAATTPAGWSPSTAGSTS